ncbi:hypothetical protein KAW18_04545 [candidate division WOR-3 bacterium]|nr:hypothetical protein [candidate division WOR-3 bacterium]
MRYKKIYLLFLISVVFTGCTRYTYYGAIRAEDSVGEMKQHLIYWTRTERLLWFDECSGTIRLLTEGSLETIPFDETEKGIIFRYIPTHKGVTHPVGIGEACGEILDVKEIKELTEGALRLKIYCTYDSTDFTVGTLSDHAYLKAKDTIYVFDIIRKKSSEFEDGVPKRPE